MEKYRIIKKVGTSTHIGLHSHTKAEGEKRLAEMKKAGHKVQLKSETELFNK